ncbi:hypothetical protein M1558_01195, partial [Candidatus Parvarchaeota archaeon]|nr:hypothetical protein [Candidatus Parvarchaeota archaeon]
MQLRHLKAEEQHYYVPKIKNKKLNFKIKRKKSQSALEYMMTYGWAILVVVVVAVILYSLGIFNPSSSITTTITGFAGLGSPQAICYSNGNLNLSLGDSVGYPINIQSITATNSTNGKVSITPDIALNPGASHVFVIPGICPAAGRYAINVEVEYYEPTQSLTGPYFSKGYITGQVVTAPVISHYTTFTESNLPLNTKWNVTYDGDTLYSTSSIINFPITKGTYTYFIPYVNTTPSGWCVYTPSADSKNITGTLAADSTYNVNFVRIGCPPTFTVQTDSVSGSLSFKFTVPADYSSNNVVLLETSTSDGYIKSVALPSNCYIINQSESINSLSGVFSAVCIESPGSYYINTSVPYGGTVSAAYILNGTDYSLASNMTEYTGYSSEQLNSTLSKLYPMTVCNAGAGLELSVAYKTDVSYEYAADWHLFVNNECTAKVTDGGGMIITGISPSRKIDNITFIETGLPSGFSWTVNFNGTNYSSNKEEQSIILAADAVDKYQFYNESYTEDGCNLLYRPFPSSGTYSSLQGNVTVKVQYYAYSNSCTPFTVQTDSVSGSLSFKFTVPADYSSNNVVLLETSTSDGYIKSVALPSNCYIINQSESINSLSGVFSAVCIESPGSYYINTSVPYGGTVSAAYILNGTDYSLASNMTEYTGYSSEQLNSTLSKLYPMTVCNAGAGLELSVAYKTDVSYEYAADWHLFVNNECTAKVTDGGGMIITGISPSRKIDNITFIETGLPSGFSWTVNFNGTNYSSNKEEQSIILAADAVDKYQFYNESYTEDGCNLLYRPFPSSGTYSSLQGNVTVKVQYYAYSNSCTPFTVQTDSVSGSLSFKFTVPADYSSNNVVLLETSTSDGYIKSV